ncbi:MAG: redox-regulated ATPase YchF [Patescibacteria group bacterium]
MSFSIGIVGLPNVGKSTLFHALTKKQVDTSNYPFCTIDPNVGVVAVPDERLEALAKISRSEKVTPTVIEFYDIAGLVRGAHKGEGLGNQFLSHIGEVDAIAHVVRTFEDPDVIHVVGKSEPEEDIDIINVELIMADLNIVQKRLETVEPKAKSGDKEMNKLLPVLNKLAQGFDQGKNARQLELSDDEKDLIKDLNLLTMKPSVYVLNVGENYLKDLSQAPVPDCIAGEPTVAISAKMEAELADLSTAEAENFLKELHLDQSGLERLVQTSYKLLNLITFLTTGPTETRAWTVKKGTLAPAAAGAIHTDFQTGFIKAEVINWQELVKAGSESNAKEKGLVRIEGKTYQIQDGDTVYFHTAK